MSIIDNLLDILVPHECLGCGAEGSLICPRCWRHIPLPDPTCYRCSRPVADFAACSGCRPGSQLDSVHAAVAYKGVAKQLIHHLKYSSAQAAAKAMAEQMRGLLVVSEPWLLVPVPTASGRVRERGYDQAHLLARELSRVSGLPRRNLLRRHGQTHQVGAGRQKRLSQLAGAFTVKSNPVLATTPLLLVDDVLTTGATLESAAAALRQAGAQILSAAVSARAV